MKNSNFVKRISSPLPKQTLKFGAIKYEELYKNVWKDTANERKYRVANVIFHLRKKIEQDVNKPQYIKTIRSKGYMLTV